MELIHSRGYYATIWEGETLEEYTIYELRDLKSGELIERFEKHAYEDYEIAAQAASDEDYFEHYRIVLKTDLPSKESVTSYCKKHNLKIVVEHFKLPFDFYPNYEDALATEFEPELS